jgi:hypothetical protein
MKRFHVVLAALSWVADRNPVDVKLTNRAKTKIAQTGFR